MFNDDINNKKIKFIYNIKRKKQKKKPNRLIMIEYECYYSGFITFLKTSSSNIR